ncbi:MAG TPA: nicotinate-nucleotide adenylyltransferase [Stenomitos sp.]
MVRIALFGTSADPPTIGHQAILEHLAVRFDEVAVWAADNPFKSQQTPLVHRQAMLELLVQALHAQYPNLQLYPHLGDARTIQSVRIAQQQWPQAELTLVVGSDVLTSLPSWYCVRELLTLIHLLVVPRPGAPLTDVALASLQKLGSCFKVADFSGPDVSSTAHRQAKTTDELIPAIADYIQTHHLYSQVGGSSA